MDFYNFFIINYYQPTNHIPKDLFLNKHLNYILDFIQETSKRPAEPSDLDDYIKGLQQLLIKWGGEGDVIDAETGEVIYLFKNSPFHYYTHPNFDPNKLP